jgi:hypothetical protein
LSLQRRDIAEKSHWRTINILLTQAGRGQSRDDHLQKH